MHQLNTSPILVHFSPDRRRGRSSQQKQQNHREPKPPWLCSFSLGANFAGSPARTPSDLALRPIWMHSTWAGPGASDPEPIFPGNPCPNRPQDLSQGSCPQIRALFQRTKRREGSKGRGGGQEPRRREQGKPLKTKGKKKKAAKESPEVEPLGSGESARYRS